MANRPRTSQLALTKNVVHVPRDVEIYDFIQRHRYATTREIHKLLHIKGLATEDPTDVRRRLWLLKHGPHTLLCPKFQENTKLFCANYLLYGLDKNADPYLTEKHECDPISGWAWHMYGQTRVTAWLELGLLKDGHIFKHRDEHLRVAENKSMRLSIEGHTYIPDDFFSFGFGDVWRDFILEFDLATEDMFSKKKSNSLAHKLDLINTMMVEKAFTQWGLHNPFILIVTNGHKRAQNILKYVEANCRYPKAFLVRSETIFREHFPKVREWFDIYEGPWLSTTGTYYINRP